MSLHIGLDAVDAAAYGGWHGTLKSSVRDARAMDALAAAQGIDDRVVLLGADATYAAVKAGLVRAADSLAGGDYLLVTFAGHGAGFKDIAIEPDRARVGDERDGRDEAWCLYDGFFLDDEVHALLCRLPAALRVFVVLDSCFSGTATRGEPKPTRRRPVRNGAPDGVRRAPAAIARAAHHRNYPVYAARKAAAIDFSIYRPAAHVIALAACQDDQGAREHPQAGAFTERLLAVWDRGAFTGSHPALRDAIAAAMPATQQPQLDVTHAGDAGFVAARPFTP